MPDIVTRDEFYARLRERLPGAPAPLTAFAREVLLRRSAHAARTAGAEPPFNLRPGLVSEILALYDELRRRHKTVADFDRLMTGTLESSAPYDRVRYGTGTVCGVCHYGEEPGSRDARRGCFSSNHNQLPY